MKITNISNPEAFFEMIDSCKGKVELVSGEGDRLNLKSKLSQYVSLAKVFSDGVIDQLDIIAYEPDDIDRIVAYVNANK
ncbi:polya polymerase [Anaerosporobacter faecicola]|uniref:polya polymerase n=1 Tax=Anaerosporobacter faecicola TaxID=2718714 RepID=UPI00143B3813|nr:polya polymerase [Anaerosporobacter faecicola]